MYNTVICYLHVLQNDHCDKSRQHLSPYIITEFFFFWWKLWRSPFLLSSFQIYYTVLLTKLAMLYITSQWLIYYITGTVYLLTSFTHSTHIPSPASGNYQSACSLYIWAWFFVCIFLLMVILTGVSWYLFVAGFAYVL